MKTIILFILLTVLSVGQGKLKIHFDDNAWTPDKSTTTLWGWYEFDDLTTITKDGGNQVSSWADKSGNLRHLTTSTATTYPIWSAAAITFDGGNDYLITGAKTLNAPVTIYAVIKQVTWTAADLIWDGHTISTMGLRQETTTPNISVYEGAIRVTSTGFTLNTYKILKVTYIAGANNASITINGGTPDVGTTAVTTFAGFTLGSRGGIGARYSNIAVKAIIIYNGSMSAADNTNVMNYLNKKYVVY